MLAVFYGCGLRRGEVAGLDVADYDAAERSLTIRHAKRGKQRIVYLTATGARLFDIWAKCQGRGAGGRSSCLSTRPGACGSAGCPASPSTTSCVVDSSAPERPRSPLTISDAAASRSPHRWRRCPHCPTPGRPRRGNHDLRYDMRGEAAKQHAVQALQIPAALPMS